MNVIELKPCPWCNNAIELHVGGFENSKWFWVMCDGCGCSGPEASTKEEAINKWNKRDK